MKPVVRRKPFKQKNTKISTDPEPLAELLERWRGIAARLRRIAEHQGEEKDYSTAADNAQIAEVMEICANDLEKSLTLYTIEEIEGAASEAPKRKSQRARRAPR